MTTANAKAISAETFHDALIAAGVLRTGERVRRIVIDAQLGHAVVVHVERIGDQRLLELARTLDGVEIREVDR